MKPAANATKACPNSSCFRSDGSIDNALGCFRGLQNATMSCTFRKAAFQPQDHSRFCLEALWCLKLCRRSLRDLCSSHINSKLEAAACGLRGLRAWGGQRLLLQVSLASAHAKAAFRASRPSPIASQPFALSGSPRGLTAAASELASVELSAQEASVNFLQTGVKAQESVVMGKLQQQAWMLGSTGLLHP